MLIPIIKDFNNNFSYLVSTSSEKAKEMFLSKALPAISDTNSYGSVIQNPLEMSWTIFRIIFLYLLNTIKYIISFQWLRDFAYLPISIPTSFRLESLPKFFLQSSSNNNDNEFVQKFLNSPNILQRYLFSNQTLTTNVTQGNMPYQDFLLGASHSGTPLHSWNLSFLCNDWFDPLTVPVNFLYNKNLSQLSFSNISETQPSSLLMESNFLQNLNNGNISGSHMITMCLLICIGAGFSSFFNSFFIGFPFSLSTILSLRYLIIQKFFAGCLSVLGIVLGEMTFMLLLILPPPFIQISLVYLESVWPYIFGLCLIIFIIIDILSNPYNYSMSLSQVPPVTPFKTNKRSPVINFLLKVFNISPIYGKIFFISFLLSLTEESCFFSFFGSLNLSSTANFIDTYLFTASQYPIVLLFSCIGFVIGSFLAINIYNYIIAKLIFLFTYSGNYYFNRIKTQWLSFFKNFFTYDSTASPQDKQQMTAKEKWKLVSSRFVLNKHKLFKGGGLGVFYYLLNTIKNFIYELYHFIVRRWPGGFLIRRWPGGFLPGGKRIFSLYANKKILKSDKNNDTKLPSSLYFKQNNKIESNMDDNVNKSLLQNPFLLSLETSVENSIQAGPFNNFGVNDSVLPKQPSLTLENPRLYNKIDKILLTLLITLCFTTIPYYSFDYLVNSIFGFIPQDQILNSHSLRVNFPDYTNLLGITLSDKNSVINTDVSLYDRAHFMYGEWPNSFESLNYQGEFMWTNLRDHRRQKRTRRSTRLKFKTLKTKISTSWKEFKRGSGFSESMNYSYNKDPSNVNVNNNETNTIINDKNKNENSTSNLFSPKKPASLETIESNNVSHILNQKIVNNNNKQTSHYDVKSSSINQAFDYLTNRRNHRYEINRLNNNDIFSKNSHESPLALFFGKRLKSKHKPEIINNENLSTSSVQTEHYNENNNKALLQNQRVTRFSETIQPLATSSFIDLSGGEKYIKTYPKNWKKAIIEKYYANPIYKTLLSSDLKPFLKREPKSQQLTNRQENELYFLRIKMAHYYDSLRFYFSLKGTNSFQTNVLKTKAYENNNAVSGVHENSSNVSNNYDEHLTNNQTLSKTPLQEISKHKDYTITNKSSYPLPPFQFKSMTSMNYRQQFKGTLKTVKQLFAISLHNNNNYNNEYNEQNKNVNANTLSNFRQQSEIDNQLSNDVKSKNNNNYKNPDGMETFYKYDKYLFNEHYYSNNEFLHEEAKSRKKPTHLTQNTPIGGNKISSSTKTIYNMFGSNDPFYVGWDQNLRKFVLTSRILPRASALNRQIERVYNNSLQAKHVQNNSQKSVQLYRPYTCWPFFKHQLKNLSNRPYLVLYENYLNILNKRIHLFQNINSNDIDTKSLTFLYSYSFKNNVKKYVSQLPINLYKQAMRPSSLENLFTPVSNARSSFLWPGAVMPVWEYVFTGKNIN